MLLEASRLHTLESLSEEKRHVGNSNVH
jgi:hypothetical protein